MKERGFVLQYHQAELSVGWRFQLAELPEGRESWDNRAVREGGYPLGGEGGRKDKASRTLAFQEKEFGPCSGEICYLV